MVLKDNMNILLVVTSHGQVDGVNKITGFNLEELVQPYRLFQMNNYHCEIASVKGGKCTFEPASVRLDDPAVKAFMESKALTDVINNSQSLNDFDPLQFAGVFFVGGAGCLFEYPHEDVVRDFAKKLYENGGVIGAVGHGIIALVNSMTMPMNEHSLIEGKTVTGFSNEEESASDMVEYYPDSHPVEYLVHLVGGHFVKGEVKKEFVVRDDRIITGQNPASSVGVAGKMIEIIEGLPSNAPSPMTIRRVEHVLEHWKKKIHHHPLAEKQVEAIVPPDTTKPADNTV
jgi:putative intracellular protease/amidase